MFNKSIFPTVFSLSPIWENRKSGSGQGRASRKQTKFWASSVFHIRKILSCNTENSRVFLSLMELLFLLGNSFLFDRDWELHQALLCFFHLLIFVGKFLSRHVVHLLSCRVHTACLGMGIRLDESCSRKSATCCLFLNVVN